MSDASEQPESPEPVFSVEVPPAAVAQPSGALAGCRSVTYVLAAAALLTVAVVFWRVREWGPAAKPAAPLDLTTCLVPRDTILRGAIPGSIPRLRTIRTLSPSEADATKIRRGKFLVKGDLVIGVVQGGQAMAYPLRFLVWHEVVDHEVGGVPLVICYGPWDGGVGVFERTPLNAEGKPAASPLDFVPSGVVSNSSQLLASQGGEGEPQSLWSSLQGRAVTGPAAAAGWSLRRVPAEVLRWEDWRSEHPETRVLAHDDQRLKLYGRAPYKTYLGSETLRFPVDPLPPAGLPRKAAVLAVRCGSEWRVYSVDDLVTKAEAGETTLAHGERELTFQAWRNGEKPAAARIRGPIDEVVRAYWYAWYASRPDARTLVR